MSMNEQGKAVLPLIEMTMALFVLAICSVITVSLFLYAHFAGEASKDTNMALFLAQSRAEQLHTQDSIPLESTFFYDAQWEETKDSPVYVMTVLLDKETGDGASLYSGAIAVEKTTKYPFLSEDRKKLATLEVSVFRPGKEGLDE